MLTEPACAKPCINRPLGVRALTCRAGEQRETASSCLKAAAKHCFSWHQHFEASGGFHPALGRNESWPIAAREWRRVLLQRTLAAVVVVLCAVLGMPAGTAMAAGKYSALVIDANTGAVLHAEAADEPRYPASLAKMMTLYLTFEQMERGRLAPSTKIKISPEAASAPPTKMRLETGDEVALIDAIKGLITKSANDAAIAIAEH